MHSNGSGFPTITNESGGVLTINGGRIENTSGEKVIDNKSGGTVVENGGTIIGKKSGM